MDIYIFFIIHTFKSKINEIILYLSYIYYIINIPFTQILNILYYLLRNLKKTQR